MSPTVKELLRAAAPREGPVGPRPRAVALLALVASALALLACPSVASAGDRDGDGTPNHRDRNVDGDGANNARDADIDGDGVRNGRDRDVDGDGAPNARDRDIDGDGAPNRRDSDMDCDRVPNRFDADVDGDGIRNPSDPDSDADGIRSVGRIPRRARLPKTFFGLTAPQAWASEGPARDRQLRDIARTGVGTLRQTFEWSRVELSPGAFSFRAYDSVVAAASRRGLTVLPVLFHPPEFRSARPSPAAGGTYPPRSAADFAAFAYAAVGRYGPAGSFWAEHPSVPRRPIRSWQVWNEPHLRVYWPTGPDPAAYTGMLRVVARGIKAADPGAEVISAALSHSNIGMPILDYVRGMYSAGAKGSFDSLAIHPYAQAADQVYKIMRNVRRVANRSGDRQARLRVTELGWATAGPRSPFRASRRGQAELIRRTWATLVKRRARLNLGGLVYYSWRDMPPYSPTYKDFYGLHTGLLDRDGRSKPARARFTRAVRAMTAR